MYEQLGAHLETQGGAEGTRFEVWAPNASQVSLLCNQNGWTHGSDPFLPSDQGIWRGFVAGMGAGDAYKFGIKASDGRMIEKADPFAFAAECPPKTASIVCDLSTYDWRDGDWIGQRAKTDWVKQPISIYEVHLASWRRPSKERQAAGERYLSYRELADQLASYIQEMGYTHVQLMPTCEFPFDGSWGYQTTGYYAPTSRFGSPQDFMHFVDHLHQCGIGVLVDWVPAHFPADAHGLAEFDGTCCYEHSDPREGFHPDWKSNIFNYGRHEVKDFLINSARFWFDKYHVDGIRVDAVASMLYRDYSRKHGEWIPNEFGGRENLEAVQFLKDFNTAVHAEFPGVLTIAEESTSWPKVTEPVYNGGLGFNLKWDMGWMNDTLHYMRNEPIHRSHHQGQLSFRMVYAFSEKYALPLSHDEVVHGKRSLICQMPGDDWQRFANLRLLYGYQYTTPGKPLLFMGGEFGQWEEWNFEGQLDWGLKGQPLHDGLRRFVGDLNRVYRDELSLHQLDCDPAGFQWIQCDDHENSVFAFTRFSEDRSNHTIVILNFTPVLRSNYRIGVHSTNDYTELINSDASLYGGSNLGNSGRVEVKSTPQHGLPQSVSIELPPLGMVVLKSTSQSD